MRLDSVLETRGVRRVFEPVPPERYVRDVRRPLARSQAEDVNVVQQPETLSSVMLDADKQPTCSFGAEESPPRPAKYVQFSTQASQAVGKNGGRENRGSSWCRLWT